MRTKSARRTRTDGTIWSAREHSVMVCPWRVPGGNFSVSCHEVLQCESPSGWSCGEKLVNLKF